MYYYELTPKSNSNFYTNSTAKIYFILRQVSKVLKGIRIFYDPNDEEPTLANSNIITLTTKNSSVFFGITVESNSDTNRCISIPSNKTVAISVNGNLTLAPTNNSGIIVGANSNFEINISSDLTVTGASSGTSATPGTGTPFAGVNVP
jgi:hypothetical protein